jgi:hypothetical protein
MRLICNKVTTMVGVARMIYSGLNPLTHEFNLHWFLYNAIYHTQKNKLKQIYHTKQNYLLSSWKKLNVYEMTNYSWVLRILYHTNNNNNNIQDVTAGMEPKPEELTTYLHLSNTGVQTSLYDRFISCLVFIRCHFVWWTVLIISISCFGSLTGTPLPSISAWGNSNMLHDFNIFLTTHVQFPHITLHKLKNTHVLYEVVKELVMKRAIFWDKCCAVYADSCWPLAWLILHSWQWRWHVTCSSKTSDDFQHTTWYYFPEDRNLQSIFNSRNTSAPDKICCWYNDIKYVKNYI